METRLSNYLDTVVSDFEITATNLIERSRKETLDEVIGIIALKQNQLDQLLNNGLPILHTTYGDRFEKLYELRQKLWLKWYTLNSIYLKICEMRYK